MVVNIILAILVGAVIILLSIAWLLPDLEQGHQDFRELEQEWKSLPFKIQEAIPFTEYVHMKAIERQTIKEFISLGPSQLPYIKNYLSMPIFIRIEYCAELRKQMQEDELIRKGQMTIFEAEKLREMRKQTRVIQSAGQTCANQISQSIMINGFMRGLWR